MAASLILAFWPGESGDARRAITENNLGTALQEEGRAAEAVERYQRALAFDGDYAPALNNFGTALRAAGRIDEAVKCTARRSPATAMPRASTTTSGTR